MSTGQSPQRKPTGTVALIHASDTGRFSGFSGSCLRFDVPKGWHVQTLGNYDEAHARNFAAEQMWGDYLWFIDDDQRFDAYILRRLLAHDVDVVAPLVLQRRAPFRPVAMRDGDHLDLSSVGTGLVEVELTGTSGMLVKREVFEDLPRPWFWHVDTESGEHLPSDTNFCRSLNDANVAIMVDLDTVMGHYNVVNVEPRRENGRWVTGFFVGNEECFTIGHTRQPLEVVR